MMNKLLTFLLTVFIVINPVSSFAQAEGGGGDFIDESLKDFSIVMGAGAVGAVLGLSTLSFVEEPKDHLKNVAIGGAIGIVIGVGIVIFSQATKSQTQIISNVPVTEQSAESLSRIEFASQRIAAKYDLPTSLGFSLSF